MLLTAFARALAEQKPLHLSQRYRALFVLLTPPVPDHALRLVHIQDLDLEQHHPSGTHRLGILTGYSGHSERGVGNDGTDPTDGDGMGHVLDLL
jgi:hypothetical protein